MQLCQNLDLPPDRHKLNAPAAMSRLESAVFPRDASPLLEATDLSFQYRRHLGVSNLSFSLHPGEIIALLGPNGAGKTTTLSMLSGCLAPHAGRITVCGYDLIESPKQARHRLGYLPETPPLYSDMHVHEFLSFCARLHGLGGKGLSEAISEACEKTHLSPVKGRLIGHLSRGMRQRVGIAQALVHQPPVLILDEPTATLDPVERSNVQNLIREIGQQHGVLLSTHLLSEAEQLATRIFILHHGKIAHESILSRPDTPGSRLELLISGAGSDSANPVLQALPGVRNVVQQAPGDYLVDTEPECDPRNELAKACLAQGWCLLALSPYRDSFKQVFLQIVSGESQP